MLSVLFRCDSEAESGGRCQGRRDHGQKIVFTKGKISTVRNPLARGCSCSISLPLSFGRGSLTIEAAVVLPLFLLAMLAVISVSDMIRSYMEMEYRLYSISRSAAVYGYAMGSVTEGREGDWIRLKMVYPSKSPVKGIFGHTLLLENHVNVHIFNGYSGMFNGDDITGEDEFVYITESGYAYHRRRDCSHLNVSIRQVNTSQVSALRNDSGGIFYLCPRCGRGYKLSDLKNRKVYVTDWGNKYHTDINCSDLKRTISVVPLSRAGGRYPCRDCA